jgi:hypothetical protein
MTDRWVWLYDRVIASDTKAARQVLDEMLAQLEAQHWLQRDIFAVHLATEEALVNAIYHGNESDEAKRVHVVFPAIGSGSRSATKAAALTLPRFPIRRQMTNFTSPAAAA